MKTIETVARRVFFYGSFVVAVIAVCEKIANIFKYTLLRGIPEPSRFLEFAAIGLLFSIAMQLHQVRVSLDPKSTEPLK